MNDAEKTKAQLFDELTALRQRIAKLEAHNTDLNEERYRLLAANVTDMISRHSMDGVYLDVTESCGSLLGYQPKELIGRNAYDLIHPDDIETVRESHDTIVNHPCAYTVEYRIQHKKGDYLWVESISHVVETEIDERYILVVTRDLTKRRLTEEKLAMFQYSIDQATDAIFWITQDGSFSYVNEQACCSLGYSHEELLGLKVWDINPLYLKEQWDKNWHDWQENQQGECRNQETLHRHKDGSIFPVEVSSTYLRFGNHELHVAVCRDITKRKQMAQDLLLTQLSVDQASIGIVRTGQDAQILSVNPYFCQLLGYTAEELCTMHTYDIDPAFPLEKWRDHRAHIRQHGSDTFETFHRRKDGTLLPVEVTTTYVPYQDDGFSFSFVHNITERKQAEEALRLSNFALERTADAVYWMRHGQILDANEAACNMLGYSREEFRNMPVTTLDPTISKTDPAKAWEYLKKEGVTIHESHHKTKDGRLVPIEIIANYIAFEGKEFNCCFVRDITHRKQAEEALRQSEERLQQAVHAGNIGIFDHDHIQNIVYWSPEKRKIMGWGLEESVTLQECLDQTHPYDIERITEAMQRAHDPAGDGSYNVEYRIVDRNGATHWVNVRSQTLFEGEGKARHAVRTTGATADITERKQTEMALQMSEERLQQAIHAGNVGIFDHDHLQDTIYWSPGQRKMFGWDPEEDKTLQDFLVQVHPDDRERIREAVQRAHAPAGNGLFDVEYRIIIHFSGAVRWLSTRSRTYFEGVGSSRHPVRTTGATVDITERRQAEAALQVSEERLQQALRVGNIGIFDHDHIQNTIYLSPEYRKIMGWEPDESISLKQFFERSKPGNDDLERVLQAFQQAHDPAGDGSYHMERRIITPNGTAHWLSTHSHTFFEGEGSERHPVRTIGATADITEHKQMEQQRLDLALEKERSDTLRMLIGNISHDIKTPLTIINTSLYLLERLAEPQKRQEKINSIKSQVRNLEHFIQDLLAISRLDGNPPLQLTPVNVNDLVIDIETETQPMIEQKQITFTLDLAEDMLPIQADQADLRRALTNLVENALNYTPTGHTVTVRTHKQVDKVLVEVMDTGIGISEDDLPYIFDRFYRSSQAQSIIGSGSGLGLAIVQRIIEMHRGSIDVMSQVGTGTTFRVQFPLY